MKPRKIVPHKGTATNDKPEPASSPSSESVVHRVDGAPQVRSFCLTLTLLPSITWKMKRPKIAPRKRRRKDHLPRGLVWVEETGTASYHGLIEKSLLLSGCQQRESLEKTKLNMQPGDAADYEAEARSYFESLRQPFEQTLKATQKDHPRFALGIGAVIFIIGVLAIPFSWAIATFVFHQNAYILFGKPRAVTEISGVLFLCCLATFALSLMVQMVIQVREFRSATRPLTQRVMVFALSYAIVRELDSFERSNLPHHRHTAITLLAKLLTYLRWALQGMNPDSMHFHSLPPKDYAVAPYAQKFAEVLNWSENSKAEYSVVAALNSLHSKVSPRLQNMQDIPLLKSIFQGIGNFFYTIVVQRRNGQTSWGYAQLLQSAEIINGMSTIAEPEGSQRAPFFSTNVFTHTNIAVAFLAWWLIFQASFVVLISMSFRFFPTLTMNSQAMVGLLAAPIAAAISMVGISRKNS